MVKTAGRRRWRRWFGLPIGGGGIGIGTIIVLGLIGWALGIDPSLLIGGAEQISRSSPSVEAAGAAEAVRRRRARRATRWAASSAACSAAPRAQWKDIFSKEGQNYRAPVLVLYCGRTHAQCGGTAQSAMGPFYCPADQKVYLDTSFFHEIETRFRGCDVGSKSCQFAQAYVIAHEIGHHVQNQLGILQKAQQLQRVAGSRAEANRIQVRVELQADCLAGVWANHANASLRRRASRRSSSRATSRRRCAPRRRSATTRCRSARRATWCRTASPTAPPSSASAGS